MNGQADITRYLVIFALAAPGAAVVWFVFHAVYYNLREAVSVVGYVDPMTQTGIDLGYIVMIGGTFLLAVLAAWSGFKLIGLLLQRRRGP
ncbi:MAG: hypothetical protein WA814_07845 [Candidatus Baltobacteraceae bacterium]